MDAHWIPPEVQRYWLGNIRAIYERINRDELRGQLKPPVFQLDGAATRLGAYHPATRTLALSVKGIVAADSWSDVEETVRHEMAHQVVHEIFGVDDVRPHGEFFLKACRMLRVSEAAARARPFRPEEERILDKVTKLLKLAESSNAHEAEAAMTAAHRLLLTHNLSLAAAETRSDDYVYRRLSTCGSGIPVHLKIVSGILRSHFFVETMWLRTEQPASRKRISVLEVMGRPHNVAMAAHVHDFLLAAADRLWDRYLRDNPGQRPLLTVYNDFRIGVVSGFAERLRADVPTERGTALIWSGDPGLREFSARRHPHTHTLGAGSYRASESHAAGRAEGRALSLRAPVGSEGAKGVRGALPKK